MVVFQDAYAHALESGQVFESGNVDVVQILHPDRFLVGVVAGTFSHFYLDAHGLQLLDGLVGQYASARAPEVDADREFAQVVVARLGRQGGEQEIHVALPRMARRQFGPITGHGAARTVDAGEVHTVHTAYHLAPGVGVDGAVECQILLGSRDERTRHALLFERYARLIEEVVEPVVVPAEPSVCRPDVGREPVVQDVGVVDVGAVAACPDQVPVLRRAFSRVYRAPSVVALLRSDADQTAGTVCPLEPVVPLREQQLEFVVPHLFRVEREVLCRVALRRHFAYPQFAFLLLPRPPVGLVHGGACGHFEGDADAIDFQQVFVGCEYAVDIAGGLLVLYLIVHVEYAEFPGYVVAAHVVDAQIEHHGAVLASGE